MGHHSVAFTMDRHADAWPQALTNAGEKPAELLFAASGGKTAADTGGNEGKVMQLPDLMAPPAGVECVAVRH